MSNHKLNIRDVLSAMDHNDTNYYDNLSKEEQKSVSIWLVMRWMSSVSGSWCGYSLTTVNDLVNANFTLLYNHPKLQMKLLAICGVGKSVFHEWVPPPKKKGKSKVQEILAKLNPEANNTELELLESMYTKDDLKTLFLDMALDDKVIKELLKGK